MKFVVATCRLVIGVGESNHTADGHVNCGLPALSNRSDEGGILFVFFVTLRGRAT